jgi:hypothetical protein
VAQRSLLDVREFWYLQSGAASAGVLQLESPCRPQTCQAPACLRHPRSKSKMDRRRKSISRGIPEGGLS